MCQKEKEGVGLFHSYVEPCASPTAAEGGRWSAKIIPKFHRATERKSRVAVRCKRMVGCGIMAKTPRASRQSPTCPQESRAQPRHKLGTSRHGPRWVPERCKVLDRGNRVSK